MDTENTAFLQRCTPPSELVSSMAETRDLFGSMADDLDMLIVNSGVMEDVVNVSSLGDQTDVSAAAQSEEDRGMGENDAGNDTENIDQNCHAAPEITKDNCSDSAEGVFSDYLIIEDNAVTVNQVNCTSENIEDTIDYDPELTIIKETCISLEDAYDWGDTTRDDIENDPDLTIIDVDNECTISLDEDYYSAQDTAIVHNESKDDEVTESSDNAGALDLSHLICDNETRTSSRKQSLLSMPENQEILSQYLSLLYESWPLYSSMSYDVIEDGQRDADFVMGESTCTLTLLDVADILQAGYAFISGGKTGDGCPIITFPDIPDQTELTDDQYRRVVNYLTSIPTLQEVDLGFVLIVDRRQCGWGAIKTMLLKIAGFFPGLVNEVCVLRPSGFFQRTVADVGFKFVRDDFKFKVLMYSSVEELREHVPLAQLTSDVGGTLQYDHQEWIQQRAAIEKFSANTTQIGHTLRSLCQRLQETEFPNDVTSTEALILSHESERTEVKEDLRTTLRHGEILLGCFKSVQQAEGEEEEEVESASLPSCKLAHVTAVERLLVQLEETERNFDDFWYHHEKRLQQCLQLRKFEEDFKQMHFLVGRQVETFEIMTDMGDSISRVETLLKELADFENDSETVIEKGEEVQHMGEQLIREEHYAVDCIRPKCMELQQMCEQYRELVRGRYEVLQRSKDLQERIDKASKWCSRGAEIVAGADIEGYETVEEAEKALRDVDKFLETVEDLRLNNPREFRQMFDSMITPETRGLVQDLLKRIEDTQAACERRRGDLKKTLSQIARPVPNPPATPESGGSSAASHSGSSDRSESPVSDDRKRKKSLTPNILKKNHSSDRLQRMRVEIIRNDGDVSDNSITSLEEVDSSSNLADMDTMHAKQGHVMRELIDTERIYVSELSDILTGYLQQLENPEMEPHIPEDLKGRECVLFGNLDKIHEFHSKVFLKDLENCRLTPNSVGKCFVSRDQEFQIYSYYCQNKPNSEALRKEIGDSNPFFKECQKNLNHRLPLSAYLLKPIQRITKYQLLIKEMLKYTNDDASKQELKDALQTMLGVLKYVNDIMHQVAITGFPGKLTELGRLLMQGPFNVWVDHKKDKIKDLRFKPMQRHIFLYEKRVLFCKKKDDPQQIDKSYMYKSSIETADIGLTENVKGDKRKFEIWLNGRTQVYTVQAANMDQKNLWVVEIKKVLMSQFDVLKKAREKPLSATSSPQIQSSISFDNAANNNNPMIQLGYSFSSTTDDSIGTGSVDYAEDYSSDEFDDSPNDSFPLDPTLTYIALAEYNPVETGEIRLQKGDFVRVLQEGLEGWWYVRRHGNKDEGWAPASYLDNAKRLSSLSTQSVSSNDSDMGFINLRNTASRSSTNSAISSGSHGEETLV